LLPHPGADHLVDRV